MLQPYTFKAQHRKGSQNANADALSRLSLNYLHFVLEKEEGNVTGKCAEDIADQVEDFQQVDQNKRRFFYLRIFLLQLQYQLFNPTSFSFYHRLVLHISHSTPKKTNA